MATHVRVPTIYALSQNKKNINIFLMNFSTFTAEKNLCILHGQVFVMVSGERTLLTSSLEFAQRSLLLCT